MEVDPDKGKFDSPAKSLGLAFRATPNQFALVGLPKQAGGTRRVCVCVRVCIFHEIMRECEWDFFDYITQRHSLALCRFLCLDQCCCVQGEEDQTGKESYFQNASIT